MASNDRHEPTRPAALELFAVALLSASALFYEIVLMRLLSVVHWQQFASMIISVALLGIGASGTFLTIFRRTFARSFRGLFSILAIAFGASAVACFAAAQALPFNSLDVGWNPRQLVYLLAIYLLLAVPFFCVGSSIGATLIAFHDSVGRVYAADLIGAAAGAASVVPLLSIVRLSDALVIVAIAGVAAGALMSFHGSRRTATSVVAGGALTVAAVVASAPLQLRISQFKPLPQILLVPGSTIVEERSNALGVVTAVESATIPFRHVPGMSLSYGSEPPEQVALFTDGGALEVITRYGGTPSSAAHLDHVTTAVAYHLGPRRSVLVLGAGGGTEVVSARAHGARIIDAVEVNPAVTRIVAERYDVFSGGIYRSPDIRLQHADARSFLAGGRSRYDAIQVTPRATAGTSENYLLTVEGVRDLVRRLNHGGVAVISVPVDVPPRAAVKLFATAVQALGRDAARSQLALIRSWGNVALVIRNGDFSPRELARLRTFCADRSFDIDYLPGIAMHETNQFNVLEESYFYDAAVSLLSPRPERFSDAYKFDIRPATDDRPYFSHFVKWASIPELLALRHKGGMPLLEWSYLIAIATVVQAVLAALVLILLPLVVLRTERQREDRRPSHTAGVAMYFLLLGLAFLFIEIAFVHRLTFFLGGPLHAVSTVIAGFLFFAGIGSASIRYFRHLIRSASDENAVLVAAVAVAAIALVYAWLGAPLLHSAIALGGPAKTAIALAMIAPLAFVMGMPFPIGLALVACARPSILPWAWGINGSASVVSAVLASVVAIHLGLTALVLIAALMYLAAGVVARTLLSRATTP